MLMREFIIIILCLTSSLKLGQTAIEPYVVGGDYVKIEKYPHSAFLGVTCNNGHSIRTWICGSSVVNQQILLTAAHCFENCSPKSIITATVRNEYRKEGIVYSVSKFKIHQKYDSFQIHNDIGLAKLKKPLSFGPKVGRVALMKRPPYDSPATVAGWGLVDEVKKISTKMLKGLEQRVLSKQDCINLLHKIPSGCICAGFKRGDTYASEGDSGSALVVRGYIQIGLVSYKNPSLSRSLVVYTDVGYFYDWIKSESEKLYCG